MTGPSTVHRTVPTCDLCPFNGCHGCANQGGTK